MKHSLQQFLWKQPEGLLFQGSPCGQLTPWSSNFLHSERPFPSAPCPIVAASPLHRLPVLCRCLSQRTAWLTVLLWVWSRPAATLEQDHVIRGDCVLPCVVCVCVCVYVVGGRLSDDRSRQQTSLNTGMTPVGKAAGDSIGSVEQVSGHQCIYRSKTDENQILPGAACKTLSAWDLGVHRLPVLIVPLTHGHPVTGIELGDLTLHGCGGLCALTHKAYFTDSKSSIKSRNPHPLKTG